MGLNLVESTKDKMYALNILYHLWVKESAKCIYLSDKVSNKPLYSFAGEEVLSCLSYIVHFLCTMKILMSVGNVN